MGVSFLRSAFGRLQMGLDQTGMVSGGNPPACFEIPAERPRLQDCAPAADDGKDKNYDGDNQQNVNVRAQHVEADKSKQPQDQKDYENGPQHSFSPYHRSLERTSLSVCAKAIDHSAAFFKKKLPIDKLQWYIAIGNSLYYL